jgi:predicted SAM-dependent methyltransferase
LIRLKILRAAKTLVYRKAIRNRVLRASVIRVIVGASGTNYDGWISTDYPALDVVDERSWLRLFKPGQIDALLAEHVFEHLGDDQLTAAFSNSYRFLKSGGHLRIAVPDGYHPDLDYVEMVKPGGHGCGSEDHKQLFNYRTLSSQLGKAGFSVQLLEWFDENGNFHFRDWMDQDGFVARSSRNDERNVDSSLAYTSLILDANKA